VLISDIRGFLMRGGWKRWAKIRDRATIHQVD
jgi:hypothetical protein